MKLNLLIISILVLIVGKATGQNLAKGYEYLNNKEYAKAEKIFVKAVNKSKILLQVSMDSLFYILATILNLKSPCKHINI